MTETTTNLDFNTAGEQRSFDVIPANTTVTLQLTIRPGNAGDGGWLKRSADGASMPSENSGSCTPCVAPRRDMLTPARFRAIRCVRFSKVLAASYRPTKAKRRKTHAKSRAGRISIKCDFLPALACGLRRAPIRQKTPSSK